MNERCAICRKPDLAKLIELGWNAKMSVPDLATVFGGIPSRSLITKHLQEHLGDGYANRTIPVPEAKPMSDRVLALQRTLVEEVERRIALAQERAAAAKAGGNPEADWSQWYDILDKDNQAAIASITRMQGLSDKRAQGETSSKLEAARIMLGSGGGLAPPRLTSGEVGDEDVIEGEAHEVPGTE